MESLSLKQCRNGLISFLLISFVCSVSSNGNTIDWQHQGTGIVHITGSAKVKQDTQGTVGLFFDWRAPGMGFLRLEILICH